MCDPLGDNRNGDVEIVSNLFLSCDIESILYIPRKGSGGLVRSCGESSPKVVSRSKSAYILATNYASSFRAFSLNLMKDKLFHPVTFFGV